MLKDLEFIGQKYERETPEATEKRKQEILQTYDKFQLDKIAWLNNMYKDDVSKKPLWSVYNNNIHDFEVAKNKDLKYFSHEEIKSMIKSFIYAMDNTIRTMGVLLNNYCEYWVNKGKISVNPCVGISFYALSNHNKEKLLKSKIYGMDEFYETLEKMKDSTNLNNIKPIILARYGILGTEAIFMRRLKWKDINEKNMVVNICDENGIILRRLPIDKRFVEFLTSLEIVKEGEEFNILKSDAYILKTGAMLNYNTVNTRVYNACNSLNKKNKENEKDVSKIQERIKFGDLLFTRQLEVLLNIRKERRLKTDDLLNVLQLFSEIEVSNEAVGRFKIRYESVTGDKIVKQTKSKGEYKKLQLIDFESEKFAEDVAKELGLDIND